MSAQWQKNAADAANRRCQMQIYTDGTMPADRGTDFMALGIVFLSKSSSVLVTALGTMTNDRHPIIFADDVVEAVDVGADTLTLTAHTYETGDGPFVADEVLGPNAIGTHVWMIWVDANKVAVATSLANAYANVRVALAGTETGATISDIPGTTQRGIDGFFTYEATQPETNFTGAEAGVYVEGPGYRRKNGGGAFTSVMMVNAANDVWATVLEAPYTAADLVRLVAREIAARFSKVGNDYVTRNLANTKDSHSGTVTDAGRIAAAIIDAT